MNDSALNAITAIKPNKRQEFALALARLCLAEYPYVRHADEHRVSAQMIILMMTGSDELRHTFSAEVTAVGRMINDARDIWEAYINDPALLK